MVKDKRYFFCWDLCQLYVELFLQPVQPLGSKIDPSLVRPHRTGGGWVCRAQVSSLWDFHLGRCFTRGRGSADAGKWDLLGGLAWPAVCALHWAGAAFSSARRGAAPVNLHSLIFRPFYLVPKAEKAKIIKAKPSLSFCLRCWVTLITTKTKAQCKGIHFQGNLETLKGT